MPLLISPQGEEYGPMLELHTALWKFIGQITGKEVEFIRWSGTGPVS